MYTTNFNQSRSLFLLAFIILLTSQLHAQLSITSTSTNYVIDFDNTVSGVNNGSIDGSGFIASPSSGDLDADAWAVTGMSDGDKAFGADETSADYTRGTSTGGTGTGGMYAFDISNGGTLDRALGVQPITADFTPGTITLKITNNTGGTISNLNISYDIFLYNDQNRSSSLNFSYSDDDMSYTSASALDFISDESASGSPLWESFSRSISITGLSLTNGSSYYIRWTSDDVGGSGSRDEISIDNININACTPPSTIASSFSTPTIGTTSMDISFTRGDGTGGVLVIAKSGSDVNGVPLSGNSYTANATFGSGDEIGSGNYVVYNDVASGTNTSTGNITISGLSAFTTYYFAIFEYNTSGTCYNLNALTGNATTDCITPPNATNLSSRARNTEVELSWVFPTCGDEVIVVARSSSSVTATPSGDGSSYSADAVFGNGTDIGTNEYIVYKGTGTSVTVTGLTNETTYYFKIFTRRNSNWSTGNENSETPTNNLFYISEWLIDPDDVADNPYEYVEIRGNASTALTDMYLLFLESDEVSSAGQIQDIVNIGSSSTGTNGYAAIVDNTGATTHPYTINASATIIDGGDFDVENSSTTLLLVKAPTTTPTTGTDLDSDNDPTDGFDDLPADWTLYDAVAILDGGSNDPGYAEIIFSVNGSGVGLPGATIVNLGVAADNIHYVMRQGTTTEHTSDDWVGMQLDNPSANFTIKASSDADYHVGQIITNHIGTDNPTSALPVELIYFRAFQTLNGIQLEWETASELNNDYFLIERSTDGQHFESLGRINGAGTTQDYQYYQFLDKMPSKGYNYYRLKQVDFDGQFEYSNVQVLLFDKVQSQVAIYPNPFQRFLKLEIASAINIETQVEIFNLAGQLVYSTTVNSENTTLDLSSLITGQYFIKIANTDETKTFRMIKN